MASGLNMKILAEGIETREQLKIIQDLGVNEYQGYLFSKPIAEKEFMDLVIKCQGE